MSAWKVVASFIIFLVLILASLFIPTRRSALAQSGCALHINEIMYDPAEGIGGDALKEWVELYVAADIVTDTTFFITDQEAPAAGVFAKAFTVPAGTAVGTYIVIHNDGDPANDGTVTATGIYTTTSYYMGNASTKLKNDGDDIVLYVGSDASGIPCDYVEYLDGDPNSDRPAGFTWDTGACGNPGSSQAFGTSISLDPNGTAGNSACDWAESGTHSANDPDLPITHGPDSKGWNNNTEPTAVTLAAFSVTQGANGRVAFLLLATLLTAITLWAGIAYRE